MPQPSVTQPKLSNTEFNSLHDFYNATNGPFWRWHNVSIHSAPWNFSIPHVNPCEANWQGLICSCGLTSCSVSQIFLDHHNVAGHLPDSMRNFQQMTSLILRSNNISGTITASIGNMTDLEELDLSYNRLYGEIPSSIGRLWKLKTLNLGMNRLTKIPEALYDLSNLETLDIIANRMSSSISPRLGNLTRLETLQFQGNGFTGEIPDSIRGLESLKTLDLSDNNLRGVLPDGFYELHNLTSCIITSNRLSGTIPPEIGFLKKLRTLDLSFNYLSWTVPSEIGELSKLNILYLNRNYFVGTIPLSFANLTELRTFDISSNNLYGPVDQLAGMNFTLLYLYENLFSGRFSLSSSFFQNILYLDLSQNSFTGPLPWREDVYSRFVTWYQSTSNFFDGTFPSSALTPNLRYYLLGDNLMSGSLPSHFLSNSTSLYYLAISQNYFFGPIPDSIGDLRQLNQVFMDVNMLSGTIPETLNRLLNLVVLDIDENLLSGPIPTNITRLRFLQELMIQNNLLTGSLDILLNSTNLHYMENIDVSGNLFTGTLSPQFFTNSKQLSSFAAGGNCLKGKIPDTICEAKTIVSLTLDGLTTAENCREYLFSSLSSQFNGFIVNRYLGSSIPTCLFEMPQIELLHLSGNGFSGTLPETLSISSTLNDLSLSYNALEGTIPDVIQKRTWDLLDLSYNKLSGTLHSNLYSGVLYLEVNRLSGTIPSSVLDTATISMLDGNIFQCDTFRADLPSNDPSYSKYSCGSDSANDVLYAWLGALLIVPILVVGVWRFGYGLQLSMGAVLNKIAVWRNALKSDDPKKINLLRLSIYLHEVRKTVVVISLYSIVVLIPIYVSLTVTSPSYTYQYAWSISAMLVKGETAAIALFVSLFVVVLLFFTLIQRVLVNIDREAPKIEDRSISVSSARSEGEEKDNSWLTGLTYVVVSLLNVVVMGVSDFTYVYILLNYSTLVVSLSALVLALFRLGTNNFLLWSALPLTYRWVSLIREKVCGEESYDRSKFRLSSSRYTTQDIHFLENLTLFNNIIIPGLAIVFTLPDCFYNALFAAGSVSSLYYYESCEQYIAPIGYGHFCSERFKTLSYSPPYIYSFQCSSKIVINYVEVYVIMFILTALVIPLLKIALKLTYDKLKEREANLSISSQSLTTASSLSTEGPSWRMSSWRGKVIRTYLLEYFKDFQMNSIGKDVANEEGLGKSESSSVTTNKTTSKRKKKRNKRLFTKLSLTTRINSYLTIMMCFGVLFPPLAVIAAISICSVTYFEELCIGWVLTETRRLGAGYEWYEEQIERECGGVEESSNLTIWSTLVVSCGLYGYVIFDTMGDESGWEAALPIALLMFSTPLMLFLGLRSISLVQSAFSKEKEMNEENISMEGNVDTSFSNSYLVGDSSIEMISSEVKSPLVVE